MFLVIRLAVLICTSLCRNINGCQSTTGWDLRLSTPDGDVKINLDRKWWFKCDAWCWARFLKIYEAMNYDYDDNINTSYHFYSNPASYSWLTQDCGNSIADTLELPQYCAKPLIYIVICTIMGNRTETYYDSTFNHALQYQQVLCMYHNILNNY